MSAVSTDKKQPQNLDSYSAVVEDGRNTQAGHDSSSRASTSHEKVNNIADNNDDDDGEEDDDVTIDGNGNGDGDGDDDEGDDDRPSRVLSEDMREKEDEADTIVGVSLGRAQNIIKARDIPLEEKNRLIETDSENRYDIPSDGLVDESDGVNGPYVQQVRTEPISMRTGERKDPEKKKKKPDGEERGRDTSNTSDAKNSTTIRPGSVKPPKDRTGGTQRSSLTKSLLKSLPRDPSPASSAFNSLKKFLPNPLSARPRSMSMILPKSKKPSPDRRGEEEAEKSPTTRHRHFAWTHANGKHENPPKPSTKRSPERRRRSSSVYIPEADANFRRTASDRSLYLTRSSSASSDGRDRYENIHSQVNIRFKAVKDTLHDSGKGLLNTMSPPVHLPDFHFGDIANFHQQHPPEDTESDRDAEDSEGHRGRHPQSDQNPALTEALSNLTGDVVVMGGYRGSVLRSAKPPHRQLWIPVVKAGLNLRKVNLEVGLNREDEERMEESVIPGEVLSHVGPVDVCRRLIRKLQKCESAAKGELRTWEYGYDWRLSPRLLADRFVKYVEGLPCNAPDVPREKRGAYVIVHSLGGLIVRHAVNQNPDLFAGVLYAGVPQHCVNILGPLRNGEDVLLNSRVLTAQASFTFRTSFALLPESGKCFFNKRTKERYPLDFFSAETWDEYRLSPVIKHPLPPTSNRQFIDNIPIIGKRFNTFKDGVTEDSDSNEDKEKDVLPSTSSHSRPHEGHHDKDPGPLTQGANAAANAATLTAGPDAHGIIGPNTGAPRLPPTPKAATASTIPRKEAMEYLQRTLSEVLQFKKELAFNPSHQSENRYPPFAVLYGKAVPTVYGARVWSREQIKHQDAYDDLAFAAGDGVVLASASMLPPNYRIIKGGLVKSERGHVSLLGDLDRVGQCLSALSRGRREGVGLGPSSAPASSHSTSPSSPPPSGGSGK